jgi:hypothetical protein
MMTGGGALQRIEAMAGGHQRERLEQYAAKCNAEAEVIASAALAIFEAKRARMQQQAVEMSRHLAAGLRATEGRPDARERVWAAYEHNDIRGVYAAADITDWED